jgi:hypothetical protein
MKMIKIKVKDVMGETEVNGTESELIADAGMAIWTLKKMMQKKHLMLEEDMKLYLTGIILSDTEEDVVEFLKKINF